MFIESEFSRDLPVGKPLRHQANNFLLAHSQGALLRPAGNPAGGKTTEFLQDVFQFLIRRPNLAATYAFNAVPKNIDWLSPAKNPRSSRTKSLDHRRPLRALQQHHEPNSGMQGKHPPGQAGARGRTSEIRADNGRIDRLVYLYVSDLLQQFFPSFRGTRHAKSSLPTEGGCQQLISHQCAIRNKDTNGIHMSMGGQILCTPGPLQKTKIVSRKTWQNIAGIQRR